LGGKDRCTKPASNRENKSVTKNLLIVTAILETATGVALMASPPVPVSLLLGASLDTPGGLSVARVAAAALLSLGVACWLARDDGQSRPGRAVIAAMLVYDIAVAAVLAYAALGFGATGVALWPVVVLHTALAVWCIACLRPVNSSSSEPTRP
jgi:Kef-type K+ transport system membrane component KefB